jgi:hypothetical protein
VRLLSLRISYWTKDFRAFSSGVGGAGGSIFTAERAALPDWRVCAGSGDRKPALTATSIEQDSILFSILSAGRGDMRGRQTQLESQMCSWSIRTCPSLVELAKIFH